MANLGSYPAVRASPNTSAFPEDAYEEVLDVFKSHGVRTEIQDERTTGQHIDVSFQR